MILDLTNIRAKITRAEEHTQTLYGEVQAWINRNPYTLLKQTNLDTTRYSIVLREDERAPFQRWTLAVADCLNNLRAALDYLVYAIAVSESGAEPPPYERQLQFPITNNRSEFDVAVTKRRLGEISEPVRAVFESLQPYNRLHSTLPPLLSILRDLNNTDKHRLLRLAYGALSQGNFGFVGEHPRDGRTCQAIHNFGELKDDTEIFAFAFDKPTPNMNWDKTECLVAVVIRHGKRDPGAPDFTGHTEMIALLHALNEEIRNVVYTFCKII